MQFDFPEALSKLLDVLYSNVKGALLAPELDFDAAREGQQKRQSNNKNKGRTVGKIGGTEAGVGCWVAL